MIIRSPKDFWSGALFIGLGAAIVLVGTEYRLGSAQLMGPGYFPRLLGIGLAIVGLILCLQGVRRHGEGIPKIHWLRASIVLGGTVLFGLVVAKLGVVLSAIGLVFFVSSANKKWNIGESVVLSVFLSLAAIGIFIFGLDVRLPLWPRLF